LPAPTVENVGAAEAEDQIVAEISPDVVDSAIADEDVV